MPDRPRHILIRGELVAQTAISVGSGDRTAISDNPVIRDFYDDPFIPGTSLAGVLRASLGSGSDDAEALFGKTGQTGVPNDGEASRVFVSSAWLIGDGDRPSWRNRMKDGNDKIADKLKPRLLRDHVRISPETGSAADGGKFDEEVIPRGTRFGFEIEWRPLGNDTNLDEQLKALAALLRALQSGNLRVGGSTTRGLGRVKAVHLDAREITSWRELAALTLEHKFSDGCKLPAWEYAKDYSDAAPAEPAYEINATMEIVGPLLVGGGEATDEADITCYREPVWKDGKPEDCYVIPGSAFKGVLRHRAQKIAEAVFPGSAVEIIADLFGPEAATKHLKRGAVAVDDVLLDAAEEQHTQVVPHVAIDRFTSGAVDGALYQEQPIWTAEPQTFKLRITVNPPGGAKLDATREFILAQALIDLALGDIRVGHGTRRGNGVIRVQGGPEALAPPAVGSTIRIEENGEKLDFDKLAKRARELDQRVAAGGAQ